MKNIIKENKQFLLAFFGVLLLILSGSIFISNSNVQVDELVIKSITPVYDEESTVIVTEEDGIIFNDKDQEVKYNIVFENVLDYDVKFNNVELSNPSEDFLEYKIVGITTDDIIKAGETKEIEVVLNTVAKEGWGRNFNDLLYARVVFDKINEIKDEGIGNVVPDNKIDNNSNIVNNNSNNVPSVDIVQPDNTETDNNLNLETKPEVEDKIEVEKDDVTHEMMSPANMSSNHGDIKIYVFILGACCGVAGVGLILLSKDKLSKYIMFVFVLSTPLLINADTIAHLPITLKVGFKSQNVMTTAGYKIESCDSWGSFDDSNQECWEEYYPAGLWNYSYGIRNIYIETNKNEIQEYAYRFDVSKNSDERVIAYLVKRTDNHICYDYDGIANYCYDLYLQADGVIYPNEDMSYYFSEMWNLETIENFEMLDTSNVTNMSSMFNQTGCNNEYFALDLSNFDTSNVTDMSYMFSETACTSEEFNLNLSNFNTGNVTNMEGMFMWTAPEASNFILDVSSFDTSKVTDMSGMFSGTAYNSPNFTLDVSNFDTSNVTDMTSMFYSTGYSSTVFSLDVSNFDTSKVTTMYGMFNSVGYSSSIFTVDVSGFDTSNVTDMGNMFYETGYNSSNFKTTITVRNPDTLYSGIFYGTATQSGSKIKVNYTTDTKNLVDQMVSEKTADSNVVKGMNVDNVIVSFSIEGITYNAYEGMSWEDWVNSEFNTDNFILIQERIKKDANSTLIVIETARWVHCEDSIIADYNYLIREPAPF